MTCSRCQSTDIEVWEVKQAGNKVEAFINWFFYIFLSLITQHMDNDTPTSHKPKTMIIAVCQNCDYRWKVR